MKRHQEIVTGDQLVDMIREYTDLGSCDWSEYSSDWNEYEGIRDRYFLLEWCRPDCITTQHLTYATIHGPFASLEQLEAYRGT